MRRDAKQMRRARRWSFTLSLLRCSGLLASTAAGVVAYHILQLLVPSVAVRVPLFWHLCCRWMFGLRVSVHGEAVTQGPVLYVCNHASYLDVTVLGSLIPTQFVAKADVARWPVIGRLTRLQDTLFTSRDRNDLPTELATIKQKLKRRAKVAFFPEGTSGNGNRVLPFKSSIFDAANTQFEGGPVRVQPVTIAYTRLDGLPLGRHLRPFFAWYGDMTLVHHAWRALGMGDLGVDVLFHEPVTMAEFSSRKRMAEYCQARVQAGLTSALAGRLAPPAAVPEITWQPAFSTILAPSWDLN